MISALRNSLKDGGMTTIVWVGIGSMIIGSALPLVMKKKSEGWALRVNGAEIPYTQYAAELALIRDYISSMRAQYGQFADYLLQSMGFSDPQTMTMQQLVTQQLMIYGYTTQGISIGQQTVDYKLRDKLFIDESCADLLPPFLYKGEAIDQNMLKMYLQRRAMTVEQLQQRIKERVGTTFMQHAIQQLGYVTKADRTEAITLHNAQKDIAVTRIPLAAYKKEAEAQITVEQLHSFYEQENARARRYYVPEQRTGIVWKFDATNYGITVEDAAIERYYEANKAARYTKEQAKIEIRVLACTTHAEAVSVRGALLEGNTSFATAAQQYPFNAEAAANGGLLKPIARGTGDRIIERAAFVLINDSDISPVIEHEGRFILIQRVSKSAPVVTPLVKVRDEIKQQLQATQFKALCMQDLQALAQGKDTDAIAAFVKAHNGTKTERAYALADAKNDAERGLFTLDKSAYNAVAQGNECYLTYLDTITEVQKQPFEAVKEQVKEDLIADKAQRALMQAEIDLNHAIATKGWEAALREFPVKVEVTSFKGLSADNADAIENLKKHDIDIGTINALEKVGTVIFAKRGSDSTAVILNAITQSEKPITNEAKKEALATLEKRARNGISGSYIASLYRDAKIERNDMLALLDEENAI